MQRINIIIIILLAGISCVKTTNVLPEFENVKQEQVFEVIDKVYDWQKEQADGFSEDNWQVATYYIGSMSVYHQTGYEKYLVDAYRWADQNNWQIGSRTFNADDQAAAQVYIDLYKEYAEAFMVADFRSAADKMISQNLQKDENILWWWVDALFMAPPALVQLSKTTQDPKYLSLLDASWDESYKLLYSKDDSLFFRDRRYNNDYDSQGNKIFWLRGNGWAVAGLAKVLNQLPEQEMKMEEKFKSIYIKMIDKLLSLQKDDGLWRSNLYYPDKYPEPETSGSALICYSLAWGLNNNLLNEEKYEKAMLNSWNSLRNKVNGQGKLGYVQEVGYKPGKVEATNSEIFGSGAFLLAASEVYTFFGK